MKTRIKNLNKECKPYFNNQEVILSFIDYFPINSLQDETKIHDFLKQ